MHGLSSKYIDNIWESKLIHLWFIIKIATCSVVFSACNDIRCCYFLRIFDSWKRRSRMRSRPKWLQACLGLFYRIQKNDVLQRKYIYLCTISKWKNHVVCFCPEQQQCHEIYNFQTYCTCNKLNKITSIQLTREHW